MYYLWSAMYEQYDLLIDHKSVTNETNDNAVLPTYQLSTYLFFLTCFSMSLNSIIRRFLLFSGTGNLVP